MLENRQGRRNYRIWALLAVLAAAGFFWEFSS